MAHLRRTVALPLIVALVACSQSTGTVPTSVATRQTRDSALPASTPFVGGSAWPVPRADPTEKPDVSLPEQPATPEPSIAATLIPSPAVPVASPEPATPMPTSCAVRTLDAMTEAQRIGQLFMIGLTDDRLDAAHRDAIARYHIGSVLFARRTGAGTTGLRAVADAVQEQASAAATHGVPFFIAANQEGGQVQALSGPGFAVIPSALAQGGMSPAQLTAGAARWAGDLKAAGVNLDLAPVTDVVPAGTDAQNAPIGHYEREYGHDPASVGSHVAAFVAGMRAGGVGTTAKHFPGLGRVSGNTDFTSGVVDSVTTADDPYLVPFARAIAAGVPFIMISEATYQQIDPAHLAVFSNAIINGLLRGDLGFHGVVISDSLGSTAVASMLPGDRAINFLNAGGDMIVLNQLDQAIAMVQAVQSLAAERDWFRDRIENATWHVLRAKEAAGLLDCG